MIIYTILIKNRQQYRTDDQKYESNVDTHCQDYDELDNMVQLDYGRISSDNKLAIHLRADIE